MTRTILTTMLLGTAALAGCTGANDDAPPRVQASENLTVEGDLLYRERIALPPGSTAVVTIEDEDGTLLARERIDMDGRSVPLPFAIATVREHGETPSLTARIEGPDAERLFVLPDPQEIPSSGGTGTVQVGALVLASAMGVGGVGEGRANLMGIEWIVEDVNGAGVIDDTRATLTFGEDGRITGNATCNVVNYRYEAGETDISTEAGAATLRACAPALLDQERKVLGVLNDASSYAFDETGALILRTDDGRTLLARKATA